MADVASSKCSFTKIELNTIELPPSIEIKESSIMNGCAGAFSKTLIPKDTRFGPYKGQIIMAGQKDYIDYRFAWEVFEKNSNDLKYTISAMDSKTSNWMRHVNCARFFEEQNIISVQEGYSIFYVVMKDIQPGEELLTWFDPKLLKRTKRRLSKMVRKPVGYTIELVPWSDEKKFVPEIIETKRARKKKVLRDMICLDEDPLALTRTLQSLPKLPCTPKQLAQSSLKRMSISDHRDMSLKTLRAASLVNAHTLPKAKKGNNSKSTGMVITPKVVKSKMNDNIIERHDTKTTYHNPLEEKDQLRRNTSVSSVFDTSFVTVEKRNSNVLCSEGFAECSLKTKNRKERNDIALLRKSPIKVGKSKYGSLSDREVEHDIVTAIKPIIMKQNEDGTTIVEDHDETYILHNLELWPECGDKCPCLDKQKCMRPYSSEKEKQYNFVIHFILLPEHKSLSSDNKIIYRCDVCDSAYNHAFSLKRHYLSVHVNHRYLSRDDIVNCQIETFHTGIELQSKGTEIETDTLSFQRNKEQYHVREQPSNLTGVSQNNSKVSVNFMNKLQETTAVRESRYMTCEESVACKDKDTLTVNNESDVFTTVPSLTNLAQIAVDKIRGQSMTSYHSFDSDELSVACEEIEHHSFGINLECNKSLGAELLCPHKSETDVCEYATENKKVTGSANLCHVDVDNCRENNTTFMNLLQVHKPISGIAKFHEHTTSQEMTFVFNGCKVSERDCSSEVESVEQNTHCEAIQITDCTAKTLGKVLDLNSKHCCNDDSVSKSVNNHVATDSYVKNNASSATSCENLPYKNSVSNLLVEKTIEVQEKYVGVDGKTICEEDIENASKKSKSSCSSQFNKQYMPPCSSAVIINSNVNIQTKTADFVTPSRSKTSASDLHKALGVLAVQDTTENVANMEAPVFDITSVSSNDINMGIESNISAIGDNHTLYKDANTQIHTFSEHVKYNLVEVDAETPAVNSEMTASSTMDHFPAATVSASALCEEFFQTCDDGPTDKDSCATVESCDSFMPVVDHLFSIAHDYKICKPNKNVDVFAKGKKVSSDVDITLLEKSTVHDTNELCTSAPESSVASSKASTTCVVTQNQPAQQLIIVTNLVFPVVSTAQLHNTLSSAVPQDSSPVTLKAGQTAGLPLVVISPVPCGPQTFKNSFSVLNLGSTLTGLSSSVLLSNKKSAITSSVCGNDSLENPASQCDLTSATTVTTITSSSLSSRFCSPTGKAVKPTNINQNPHLLVSNTGATKKAISKISSFISPKKNLTYLGGQPDDLYRCHMCVLLFKTMNELKQHIRNDPHRFKGGIKQYACLQCSMRFSNKNNLMRHNLMNHLESENYKFRCFTCGKGFMSETYLKMHARFHSGKNFPCKYGCVDIYFPNAASLVKHLRAQHAGLDLKEYQRNSKVEKTNRQKSNCIFEISEEHVIGLGTEGKTIDLSKTVIPSSALYNLDQPGMGFQVKRGRPKGSKNTSKYTGHVFPRLEDKFIQSEEVMLDTREPDICDDNNKLKFSFQCKLCLKRMKSHLKLLQHRTQEHGADQSVQEYLYQMSKETVDEDLSQTECVKFELSPPPSPKTFFANVNRRGIENVTLYVDGNNESLTFWQKNLVLNVPKSESTMTAESEKKIEWTMFNFPPCFEYKENCTEFYDSTPIPDTSHKLSNDIIEVGKEKDTWEVHNMSDVKTDAAVNALWAHSNHSEHGENKDFVETATNSALHFMDKNVCAKEDSRYTVSHNESLYVANKLQQTQHEEKDMKNVSVSVLETENCNDVIDREAVAADLVQKIMYSNDDFVNRQENYESDCVLKNGVSRKTDISHCSNTIERENEYLCRLIVNEIVGNAMMMAESLNDVKCNFHRSQFHFNGKSDIKECLSEGLEGAQKMPGVSVYGLDDVLNIQDDIKVDDDRPEVEIKKTISISSKSFPTADVIQHAFTELSVKEKFQVLKSRYIQGINLETSKPNHHDNISIFSHSDVLLGDKPVPIVKSQSLEFLIDALDLHIVREQLSSNKFQKLFTDFRNVSTLMSTRDITLPLESHTMMPQDKQFHEYFGHSLDNSRNNSNSKHDHRRYSIWTGQMHQKFDDSSKKEICQPVTEAVRKQEVILQQTKYKCEKSAREKEMYEKHHKNTQKICFAESLGLMARKEFVLSYHAQKQQEFTITVPEVWENYENIWFGKKGSIAVVCSICHRHFSCWDLCLRHQLKKHPHIEPASLEMEKDNYVEDMYYYYPMPYGILAQTHLIPDNLPPPEVYVCTRCGFPFKNLNRLHAHIIICDPTLEEAAASQNDSLKRPSYMKKKLLPVVGRRLCMTLPKIKVGRPFPSTCTSAASFEVKQNRSLHSHGKRSKLTPDDKPLSSVLQSRLNYSAPFSFYSGRKNKTYELLYNPQNHMRRREMYKVLDQHQCHGCNLKFLSLSMLERHVKKCSGRDKLQSQKPLLSGIMRDDAALRKQHTCRYCNKRFTYIKGVDLHYKRICAVRKVKEEENQLTEEDLAHEAELKKIIEHIKWSKSLNKDSSDIIQGHVKVEEDGTLTRIVKKRGWPQGLKKKKKGFKWTALKRHRPDDDMSCASSASGSTQSSPAEPETDRKILADIKVSEKCYEILNAGGHKRLTRSTSNEVVYQNHITRKRQISPVRSRIGKKRRTVSQSNMCNKNNDTGRHCNSKKGKLKKFMFVEKVSTSETRQTKQTIDTVKYIKANDNEKSLYSVSSPKSSCRTVTTTFQRSNVDTGNKPPARKRGRPKRFDPSDMESSYKKKKKCDQGFILHESKTECAKNDFSGRKVNSNDIPIAGISKKKQRADVPVKNNYAKESHVLRHKSPKSAQDSTSHREISVFDSNCASSSNGEVTKSKETKHLESQQLFEKMKQLKETVKSESNKSSQRRKLSSSLATKKASSTKAANVDYFHKKGDLEKRNHKKYYRPVNKTQSSSELLKHLTKDEEILLGKTSPQKSVVRGTASVSSPMDSKATLEGKWTPVKRLKITTQNICGKISAKATIAKTAQKFEDGESNNNVVQSPVTSMCMAKLSSSSANILKNKAVSKSPGFQRSSSKSTSLISKQPIVSVRVVTLSPNGTNLLTYDSSAAVPQSSELSTKSAELTNSVPLPSHKIMNSLPHGSGQLSTSAHLQPKKFQKTILEQGNKIFATEKHASSNSKGSSIIQCGHAESVNRFIPVESNMRMKKSFLQDLNKSLLLQKEIANQAQVGDNLDKQESMSNIYEYEKHEIVHSLRCPEKKISDNERPIKCQDELVIHRELKNSPTNKNITIKSFDDQIALNLTKSSCVKNADQVVPKLSVKFGVKHTVDGEITLLCNADQIFQKQMHQNDNLDQTLHAEQNESVTNSIPQTFTKSLPHSHCQKKETVPSKRSQNTVQQVSQLACSSKLKSSLMSILASSHSNVHAGNSLSPTNSHESMSAIIVPPTSVKAQVNDTTTAAGLTKSTKHGYPAKLVTLTNTVIPNLIQGNTVQTGKRMLKISRVNGTNSCMTSMHQQISSSSAQCRRMPNAQRIVSAVVTQKPILLGAGKLPRLLSTGVRLQHPSIQESAMQGMTQSVVNIATHQTNATQLLTKRQPAKIFSQEICMPQSTIVNNKVSVAQPSKLASTGTLSHIGGIKANKLSTLSAAVASPVTNQIMFSLEDGTTAMLDPDSLAQFLSTSPSLNKLDLSSVAFVPSTAADHTSTVILNVTESLPNQQSVEEISWPANGTIDLTELPYSINNLE